MKELVDGAVASFFETGGPPGKWFATEAAQKLATFIGKQFGDYSNNPNNDAYLSILRVCMDMDLYEQGTTTFKAGSAEHTKKVAQLVGDFWASVPRTYIFRFPLQSLAATAKPVEPVDCGLGIFLDLHGEPQSEPVTALSVYLDGASAGPSLAIESKGYSIFGGADDVCGQMALRTCKIVIALGTVLGIFDDSSSSWIAMPASNARQRDVASKTTSDAALPQDFARALSRVCLTHRARMTPPSLLEDARERTPGELREYLTRLKLIGSIIEKAQNRLTTKEPPNATEAEKEQFAESEHSARIITAAEWLFDAGMSSTSAMSYVQLAIGFEALFGGSKDEPVVETLNNRLAYSLASAAGERSWLSRKFTAFYAKRSRIVHHGASRLLPDEADLFSWGVRTLRRALGNEMTMIRDRKT
jgi:hypothetical protein